MVMNKRVVKNMSDFDNFEKYKKQKCRYVRTYKHMADYPQIGCIMNGKPNHKRCLGFGSGCDGYRKVKN